MEPAARTVLRSSCASTLPSARQPSARLRAKSGRWEGDRCFVLWDDDQEEELDYSSLRQAPDNAFYARARGKLRGRIAGAAQHAIAERVIEQGNEFALAAAGTSWRIADAA